MDAHLARQGLRVQIAWNGIRALVATLPNAA